MQEQQKAPQTAQQAGEINPVAEVQTLDRVDKVLGTINIMEPEAINTTKNEKIIALAKANVEKMFLDGIDMNNASKITRAAYKPMSVDLRQLSEPMLALQNGIESKEYIGSLTSLRDNLKKIDPANLQKNAVEKFFYGLVSWIPGFNYVENYWQARQGHIETIDGIFKRTLAIENKSQNDLINLEDYAKKLNATFEEKFIRVLYLKAVAEEMQEKVKTLEGEKKVFFQTEVVDRLDRMLLNASDGYQKEYQAYIALRATNINIRLMFEQHAMTRETAYSELLAYGAVFKGISVTQTLLESEKAMADAATGARKAAQQAIGQQTKSTSEAITRKAREAQEAAASFDKVMGLLTDAMNTTTAARQVIKDGIQKVHEVNVRANQSRESLDEFDALRDVITKEILSDVKQDLQQIN